MWTQPSQTVTRFRRVLVLTEAKSLQTTLKPTLKVTSAAFFGNGLFLSRQSFFGLKIHFLEGNETQKRVPPRASDGSNQIFPSYLSTMLRQIVRPMPVPSKPLFLFNW